MVFVMAILMIFELCPKNSDSIHSKQKWAQKVKALQLALHTETPNKYTFDKNNPFALPW
jgi:hypothetical protein